MDNVLTHVKKLRDPNYFGAYELITDFKDGEPVWHEMTLTILKVTREKTKTQKQTEEMVVYFAEVKKMIYNAINTKNTTKALGSPMVEHWINKQITVYVEKVYMQTTKEWVYAIRVRDTAPVKALPILEPNSDKWEGAKTAIQKGSCTIEQIRKSYVLSLDNEKLLTDAK